MKIVYSPVAQKKITKLSQKDKIKVMRNIRKIVADPHVGKKLKGKLKNLRSTRVWPYRIIYRVFGKILMIVTVEYRQKIYK